MECVCRVSCVSSRLKIQGSSQVSVKSFFAVFRGGFYEALLKFLDRKVYLSRGEAEWGLSGQFWKLPFFGVRWGVY